MTQRRASLLRYLASVLAGVAALVLVLRLAPPFPVHVAGPLADLALLALAALLAAPPYLLARLVMGRAGPGASAAWSAGVALAAVLLAVALRFALLSDLPAALWPLTTAVGAVAGLDHWSSPSGRIPA